MTDSKIQIKLGNIEFSGEGNQEWLAAQLDKIFDKMPDLTKVETKVSEQEKNSNNHVVNENGKVNLSMVSIATKLNCKSGGDLATAAAAYLKLVLGKSTFSRDDILKTMKEATGYYSANHGKNLTPALSTLLKNNVLTQTADSVYSLHINKENELYAILSK